MSVCFRDDAKHAKRITWGEVITTTQIALAAPDGRGKT